MRPRFFFALLGFLLILASLPATHGQLRASKEQLAAWLKRFPEADANKDGTLTVDEATAYAREFLGKRGGGKGGGKGAPRQFSVDPGWDEDAFPGHAVSLLSPEEIAEVYRKQLRPEQPAVRSYEKPADGALRIVGTGHSFMAPGYRTFPVIAKAAGFAEQPLYTHTGGGMTGSARYKWEQENGIFQFDKKPEPKLLASIANAEWDAMMWGPYFMDRPAFYTAWIDFCRKYHPDMKFFLSDAWPQLFQLGDEEPETEDGFTRDMLARIGTEKRELYLELVRTIRQSTTDEVFIMPTSDAMTMAAQLFLQGELPGVEGLHRAIGGKERSLWRDRLGHLGPGFDRLEGYVFFATVYGRSPEQIEGDIALPPGRGGADPDYPSPELDRIFRTIAWQAVTGHPLSGVVDEDGDGIADVADPEDAAVPPAPEAAGEADPTSEEE